MATPSLVVDFFSFSLACNPLEDYRKKVQTTKNRAMRAPRWAPFLSNLLFFYKSRAGQDCSDGNEIFTKRLDPVRSRYFFVSLLFLSQPALYCECAILRNARARAVADFWRFTWVTAYHTETGLSVECWTCSALKTPDAIAFTRDVVLIVDLC